MAANGESNRIPPVQRIFAGLTPLTFRIMLNIVLFGPPGAGKGTQSEKLVSRYNLVHLSTGDIFRRNIKGETPLGVEAKSYMDKGELVPDAVTIRMLESEVRNHPDAKGFIFDGFPRTTAQAEALDALLASLGSSISCMLALEVDEAELRERLRKRAETSGRSDDADPAVIQNRIDVYNRETAPVAGYYRAMDKYRGVDGIGSVESIFDRLCAAIDAVAV
jgi:adenylate kinase